MSLLNKLLSNSTIKETAILTESKVYHSEDMITTNIPMINVALSGKLDGGLTPGTTMIAGPSKHFKSAFTLLFASEFLKKYKDGVVLFYDSEFGTPESYFDNFEVDKERVIHTPITDIEQLKQDIMKQLKEIKRKDNVIIIIDSVGNIASKKEVDDALDGKTVVDMTRAKQLKSLFRMVTPHLKIKDIPLVAVNHTYKEMCLSGDTYIKTSNGFERIENINVGEFVDVRGKLHKVTKKFLPSDLDTSDKKFLKLTFDDGSVVRCTDNHKFLLANNEWMEASSLNIGQKFM